MYSGSIRYVYNVSGNSVYTTEEKKKSKYVQGEPQSHNLPVTPKQKKEENANTPIQIY